MTLRIALTLGDPRGIGPEVMEAAARTFLGREPGVELVLVGPPELRIDDLPYRAVSSWDGATAGSAGRAAGAAVEAAARLALEGGAAGIVTGPIHKPSLRAAGWNVPGHTELLQGLADVPAVGMLMAAERTRFGGPLRVLLATTHLPLREVSERLTPTLLDGQVRLLAGALRSGWELPEPRIALCGLNPHASDGGLFGDEEARVMEPVVERLGADGLRVRGPLPADTVFGRALDGEFDAVVAPYHDVGMAPFKTVSFGRGVNVTLGLPFVRTSPDHGTAFDIAGTGRADPGSATEALSLAWRLASGRF